MPDSFWQAEFASWGRRLGAWILDTIIFVVAFSIALFLVAAALGSVHLEDGELLLPLLLFSFLWDVAWIAGPPSGKPGHRLVGIRIRDMDGERASVQRAAIRWLVRSTNYLFVGVEAFVSAITIAATPRRQAVHDLVARTVAVTPAAVQRVSGRLDARDAAHSRPAGTLPGSGPFEHAGDAEPERHGPFREDDDAEPERRGPFL